MSGKNKRSVKITVMATVAVLVIAAVVLGFFAYKKFFDSAYQKMDDGFRVKMLVVGDSIGYGAGASDESHYWSNLVSYYVQDRYGCPVTMVNVSLGGNTSYAGYVRTLTPDEDRVYDLVFICFGANDRLEDLGLHYETVIRAIKSMYPRASIVPVLQSCLYKEPEKIEVIKELAEYYGLPLVDTVTPCEAEYEKYTEDGTHPNDAGYQVFFEEIMKVIEPRVEERYGLDPEVPQPLYEECSVFDTFNYIPASEFKREGNTFSIELSIDAKVMGIDYDIYDGTNYSKIYIDGEGYIVLDRTNSSGIVQRHIFIVNNWKAGENVTIEKELAIVFPDTEAGTAQADTFRGITFSGVELTGRGDD